MNIDPIWEEEHLEGVAILLQEAQDLGYKKAGGLLGIVKLLQYPQEVKWKNIVKTVKLSKFSSISL